MRTAEMLGRLGLHAFASKQSEYKSLRSLGFSENGDKFSMVMFGGRPKIGN